MQIRSIENADAGNWDAFVSQYEEASFYHRYAWRGFFSEYFGKRTEYLIANRDSKVVGVLPLVQLKSILFGNFYVSLPFVNYGGILSRDPAAIAALKVRATEIASEHNASHIEFRHTNLRLDLPCRTDKVSMRLALPGSPDELGKSIGSKRRSQIRRPQRENPETIFGGAELLDSFYDVFSRNMRDLGTPVYAKSMFNDLLQRFPDNTSIGIILIRNTPAACAFLIDDGRTMEIPWASTRRDFNPIGINMLLYWEVLSRAIETGIQSFDFGRSTIDSGTFRFKKQWGAEPTILNWHYCLADGDELPRLNPDNPKYRAAIRVWQKLPLSFANALGPRIVKHLP